jgi:hypothetical protein
MQGSLLAALSVQQREDLFSLFHTACSTRDIKSKPHYPLGHSAPGAYLLGRFG